MWCLRRGLRDGLVGLLATATFVLQSTSVPGQENAGDATAILKKFVDVNEFWLNPKPIQLSYVLTGTMKEEPMFVERVWIDGSNLRWELDQPGEKPSAIAVVFRGDSAVYVNGPEKLLKTKAPAGDIHPFPQGITWRTAVHTIREKGVPADAKLLKRENVEGDEVAVIEMTILDQRRVGLGLRGPYLGYAGIAGSPTLRPSRVRLHIRLPEHFPILEEYPDRDVQFRYEKQAIRFDGGLAPSSITYAAKSPDGKVWELAAHFQKYESQWLLQMAKNRQNGVVVAALEVSDVSTAPPDKALFEVPAK